MPDTTSFEYTIYVQATPERVWQALTDPLDTARYWRHHEAGPKTFRSDWKKGSTWDLLHEDVGLVVSDPDQLILESDPPNRLSYKWHRVTPEWAAEVGMSEATAAKWRAEPLSTVHVEIDDVGRGAVRLTLVHDGFGPGSEILPAISEGWPAVLSSLKTLVETGVSLRTS
jgi:uncharacterized protein YndB with AHSA1/START domain